MLTIIAETHTMCQKFINVGRYSRTFVAINTVALLYLVKEN